MHFESDTHKDLGRFTSGTSMRRFIMAMVAAVIVVAGVLVKENQKTDPT